MKTLIIAILTLASTTLLAQNTVTWKGGTPGNETTWNESRNWSNNQIPDEDTHVVIKALNTGHFAQPVIEGAVEVASIELQAGAKLRIATTGEVVIDGTDIYSLGIVSYGGKLINEGLVNLINIEGAAAEVANFEVQGNGIVLVDNQPFNERLFAKK